MSKIWKLGQNDFVKGLVLAVIVAILTTLLQLINKNGLAITVAEWQLVATAAITSGLGYLLKNLATDENNKLGGKL